MSTVDIVSPLPGTFYRRPNPDSPPFKADGATVAPGEVIGLIEVMKNFQEVVAEAAGTNIAFQVDDGDAVMAGQVLATIEA